jgi:hypothetical protein
LLQTRCTRLVAGGVASCCRTLALCALFVLCAATPSAHGASPAWRPDAPLASHAMLYLDAPYSFKRSMFQQSADLGASSIRVDLALTAVFIADDTKQWQQVDEVMGLALASARFPCRNRSSPTRAPRLRDERARRPETPARLRSRSSAQPRRG